MAAGRAFSRGNQAPIGILRGRMTLFPICKRGSMLYCWSRRFVILEARIVLTSQETRDGHQEEDCQAQSREESRETVTGEEGRETVTGEEGRETVTGEEGCETVTGEEGRETVTGEEGRETGTGEEGRETGTGEGSPRIGSSFQRRLSFSFHRETRDGHQEEDCCTKSPSRRQLRRAKVKKAVTRARVKKAARSGRRARRS